MLAVIDEIAHDYIARYGLGAHAQALAIAEATGALGGMEIAAFFNSVARAIELLAPNRQRAAVSDGPVRARAA